MSATAVPPPPAYPPPPPREGRPVSFFVALFLALLLFVSGGLNVLLLLFSVVGSAAGGLGALAGDELDAGYRLVVVDGDRSAAVKVLRVPIDGAIAESATPLIGAAGGTVSQVRRALLAAERDRAIKAILLDINSPGGGVTDSDEIYTLLEQWKHRHPDCKVMALFGDIAASGGYYIAAAADYIMARPTSITGSIGVIISSYNVAKVLDKVGIEPVTIVSRDTPFKDMMSPTRPMRPEEEEKVRAIVQEMYERFVDVVDRGRTGLSRDQVKQLATGEIYSATRAQELGLVDAIGDGSAALEQLSGMLGGGAVQVLEQHRVPTLFDSLLRGSASIDPLHDALGQLVRGAWGPRLLYFWQGGR